MIRYFTINVPGWLDWYLITPTRVRPYRAKNIKGQRLYSSVLNYRKNKFRNTYTYFINYRTPHGVTKKCRIEYTNDKRIVHVF